MTLTYEEARAELLDPVNASKYSNPDGLMDLVKRLSVEVPGAAPDALTLLCSGGLPGDPEGPTPQGLAQLIVHRTRPDSVSLRMNARDAHRRALIFLIALLEMLFSTGSIASSETLRDQLHCGPAAITVTTSCTDNSPPVAYACQKQTLTFSDADTGKTRVIDAAGTKVKDDSGRWVLDGLASAWACVRTSGGYYVVVRYDNGGNCDACEWDEIYALNGTGLVKGARADQTRFNEVSRRLGLTGYSDQLRAIRGPAVR